MYHDDTTLAAPGGATANNRFAFDLYARLCEQNPGENVCFSPFSIAAALALVHAGARGDTAREIEAVLRLDPGRAVKPPRVLDGHPFRMANAAWVHEEYPIRPNYAALIRRDHGADVRTVDFVREREPTRRVINDWVERKTSGGIANLLSRPLPAATRLILTNAVYFLARWERPFDRDLTKREPFFVLPGRPTDVWMMHQTIRTIGVESDGFRAAGIEYEGGTAMWIVLPDVDKSIAEVEASLTSDALDRAWRKGEYRDVILSLPRFHVRARCDLGPTLAVMGMPTAFSAAADFSGMHDPHPEPLLLSSVIHEAFTDVNEERTETAAATAMVMMAGSAYREPPPPMELRCDRPFLFVIRDAVHGSILFMGRVIDPTKD
jgi:serpin B